MDSTIDVLVKYFEKELPLLEQNYYWKIPKIEGFSGTGKTSYKANIELKKFLNSSWNESNNNQEKNILSKIIVADWGGVKRNYPETLESYVKEIQKEIPNTPIKGVASYSKIFSITNLEQYAIYDARVAVSLNAIQLNKEVKNGVAFNYIPGRNNITGNAVEKIGFVHQEKYKVKNLIANGWSRIKRDDTYEVYLDTLRKCLKAFPAYKLYDLEMVLFANAEKEAKLCLV